MPSSRLPEKVLGRRTQTYNYKNRTECAIV